MENLISALHKFQEQGISVTKDGKNPYFKSQYAN